MGNKQALREVLITARDVWQHAGVREALRVNFSKERLAELSHSAQKYMPGNANGSGLRWRIAGVGSTLGFGALNVS